MSATNRTFGRFVCVVLGLVLSGVVLRASVTGRILGRVTDPSGASIPGATITLRNPNTGLMRTTTTDDTGSFEFLSVPVGSGFTVQVTKMGFESSVHAGITLLVNQSYHLDIHLELGRVTQSVTVSSMPVQVATTSTQLGDVIENHKINALPLNGRSYIDLLGLQAGVVPVSATFGTEQAAGYGTGLVSGELSNGLLSVSGNRTDANSYIVNGGDVNDSLANGASVIPVLDSIQEFRVLTSSFDAEYGRFSGGLVNLVTKSGTNAFHGDLFEYLRNDTLDSRNFFELNQTNPETGQELPGTAVGEFRQNQFGGTVGGPIVKNRIFFFTDYQGTREVRGFPSGTVDVPSALERTGNFSDVGTTGYSPLTGVVHGCAPSNDNGQCMNDVLTQRLGYTVTNGEPYYTPGCTSTANCVFPGEIIPQAAWSPAAAGTLKFIATPTGSLSGTPFFSTSALKNVVRDDKFAVRIDFNNQRSGNWSVYYNFDDAAATNPFAGGNMPVAVNQGINPSRAQQVNLGNTRTFGPTKVNEWRLNYTRFALQNGIPTTPPQKPSDFGFVEGGLGIVPLSPATDHVPEILLGNLGDLFGGLSSYIQVNNTFQAKDNLSISAGKHLLKLGADFEDFQVDNNFSLFPDGAFQFFGGETGNDFADYLIGAPGLFIQSSPSAMSGRSKYLGLYGQDTYRLTPDLTLNYGLRWEFTRPWSDTKNRLQAWVPGQQSKIYPDSPTGWDFPGDPGVPSTLAPTRYHNFAPRIGIAYSPGSSSGLAGKLFGGPHMTSVRASFGIFYTAFSQLEQAWDTGDAPFALFYVSPDPVYFEEPYKGRQGTDPGQRFPYVAPAAGATGPADLALWANFQPIGGNSGAFDIHNTLPYDEDVSFSIERQLGSSTILTVTYVGTMGHHLLAEELPNAGNRALCLQVRQALGPANGCGPFGEDTIYTLPGGQTIYGTRPFSVTSGRLLQHNPPELDFADVTLMATAANSNYNALEVTVNKRAGPVQFLAAYTYSKSLDDGSCYYCGSGDYYGDVLNPYDGRLSKGLSDFNMTHNFVVSYTYDLPFQKLASSTAGPLHKLLDGWQLSGITRFTTGLPVQITESGDPWLCGLCTEWPNYNGQPIQFSDPRASADHQYFSTSQFSTPALGAIGTTNERFFSGPGLNDWDVGLHKTTQITERTSIEFRAEFFNVFNHAQFENPVGDLANPAFGQVTAARDPRIGQFALKFFF